MVINTLNDSRKKKNKKTSNYPPTSEIAIMGAIFCPLLIHMVTGWLNGLAWQKKAGMVQPKILENLVLMKNLYVFLHARKFSDSTTACSP